MKLISNKQVAILCNRLIWVRIDPSYRNLFDVVTNLHILQRPEYFSKKRHYSMELGTINQRFVPLLPLWVLSHLALPPIVRRCYVTNRQLRCLFGTGKPRKYMQTLWRRFRRRNKSELNWEQHLLGKERWRHTVPWNNHLIIQVTFNLIFV